MFEVKFYIGMGKDHRGVDILPINAVAMQARVEAVLCETWGGFTKYAHTGGWEELDPKSNRHVPVIEPGVTYVVLANAPVAEFHRVAAIIRDICNQTCVAVSVTATEVAFI